MDLLYYIYCIKMGRNEKEFFGASIRKIVKMIEIYADERQSERAALEGDSYEPRFFRDARTGKITEARSMREII